MLKLLEFAKVATIVETEVAFRLIVFVTEYGIARINLMNLVVLLVRRIFHPQFTLA